MAKRNDILSYLVAPKLTITLWVIEAINKGLATSLNKDLEVTNATHSPPKLAVANFSKPNIKRNLRGKQNV